MTLHELEDELKAGRFHPVYLILGPEEYFTRRAVSLLRSESLAAEALAFNYAEFSARESSMKEILEAAETFPVMSPRRLVLVTDVEKVNAEGREMLLAYVRRPSGKSIVVLVAQGLDGRTSFYRNLKDNSRLVDAAKLNGPALARWTDDHLRRHGIRISAKSRNRLLDLAGADVQMLVNEIEKLLLYTDKGDEITDEAVDELVQKSRQHGIFDLTRALGRCDRPAALALLGNLLEGGEPPLVIVTMMARHFRQIIIAKEMMQRRARPSDIARAAQVPAFAVDEFLRHARGIEMETARRLYLSLARIDYRVKSSNVDERLLLESLICSI